MDGRRRRRIVIAVVSGALLAVIVAGAVALCSMRIRRRRRETCISQLKNLYVFLWPYRNDKGETPDHLGRLIPEYCSSPRAFICPSSGRAALHIPYGVKIWTPEGQKILDSLGPEHTDYGHVAGIPLKEEEGGRPSWIILFEKEGNHDGGHHVLLLEYRVLLLTEAEFRQRLAQTLREARAAGLDAKVWGYAPGEGPLSSRGHNAELLRNGIDGD